MRFQKSILFFLFFFVTTLNAAEKKVTMGGIMPLSGPLSIVGLEFMRGWKLYWDEVNTQGGIKVGDDNYKVNFIMGDDKMNPLEGGNVARKLILRDKAKVVFGALLDQSSQAIYKVCHEKKVLNVIPWVNYPKSPADIGPSKPYLVRPNISPDDTQELDYAYIKESRNVKTVVIVVAVGLETLLEKAKAAAAKNGIKVLAVEQWTLGQKDFVPLFTKVVAKKPDMVQLIMSAETMAQAIAARQLGYKGIILSDSPLGPDLILMVAGANAENVLSNGMNLADATPEMKHVMDLWKKDFKEPFGTGAWQAWDHARLVHKAIEKSQSFDASKVMAAIESMTEPESVDSVFGKSHISGKERFGVNRMLSRPIPLTQIKNGKAELIKFLK